MTDQKPPKEAISPETKFPNSEKVKSDTPIEVLPPSLDKALRKAGINPSDPDVTKTLEISFSMLTASGSLPLPPPAILNDYNRAYPGLVDKIIGWTEEQRRHRMALENMVTNGAENRMNKGQLVGACVALIGLGLSALVGIIGNPYVAGVIAVVSIGGPTAAIYLARANPLPTFTRSRSGRSQTSSPPRVDPVPARQNSD